MYLWFPQSITTYGKKWLKTFLEAERWQAAVSAEERSVQPCKKRDTDTLSQKVKSSIFTPAGPEQKAIKSAGCEWEGSVYICEHFKN